MKIDLHNHSFTHESSTEPEEIIEEALEEGLDGVAFTEHNSYTATAGAQGLKEKYSGRIRIFRGVEYDAAEGHVLLFGLKDNSFMDLGMFAPLSELLKYIVPSGGVAILAHPFRGWGPFKGDITKVSGIVAIEAFNGNNTAEENANALAAAALIRVPTTGGSDSHGKGSIGRCYTEFLEDVTYGNFVEVLRRGNYAGAYGKKYFG